MTERDTTNALLVATPEVIEQALDVMTDPSVPIQTRGAIYTGLRRLRLRLDRALRPMTQEIEMAMVQADAKEWGPLRLTWRSLDVRWPVNAPGNHEDATVQELLGGWRADPKYRPFVREIPHHYEIDTAVLGEAVHLGDPGALALWEELKTRRLRTDEGKAPSLTVREEAA